MRKESKEMAVTATTMKKREKERIEIRKRQGKLMESIDSVMAYQATKLCPATNTNSYRKGSGGLYAAACAYYMNQSKEFKVFLDDLDVPADSNLVENRLKTCDRAEKEHLVQTVHRIRKRHVRHLLSV